MASSNDYYAVPTNADGTYRKGAAYFFYDKFKWSTEELNNFSSGCFPIVTRDEKNNPLNLRELKFSIDKLIKNCDSYDNDAFDFKFKVCRITSHDADDVGPMFAKAPKNMVLPLKYKPYVLDIEGRQWWTG